LTDQRIEIWNIFHDGSITAVESEGSGIRIFVSIPYLRRRVQPIGDSFVVKLFGATLCEFRHFDGETTTLQEALEVGEPEIFSTSSDGIPVVIDTTLGQLVLSFDQISFELDSGQAVAFEAIAKAAEGYWQEFENRGSRA
jgi:hypothetical protein